VVDELVGDLPAPRCAVAPELGELELGILVGRGDAGVEGDAHRAYIGTLTPPAGAGLPCRLPDGYRIHS
jgi:hypothetical protein